MDLRPRLLRHLKRLIGQPLPLRLSFWDGGLFDFTPHPNVTVTLATPRAGRVMPRGDLDRLCDAHIWGEVLVDGAVKDILGCGITLANSLGRVPLLPQLALLNHGIYLPNADGMARGPRADFIGRHVFPGDKLPTLSGVVQQDTKAGLEVADFEDLRPNYVRTLCLWLSRLEANKAQAIEIAGPERYRVWRMVPCGMAFAFNEGWLSVGQLLAYKPGGESASWRPWTRDYQYAGAPPVMARRLNWREADGCEAAHV